MKKLFAIALLAIMTLGSGLAIAGDYGKQKVVYHVNYTDEKRQIGAMRNIQNHINAVGKENLDLRVVMHGGGYTLLERANKDPNIQQKVQNLKDQGVKFNICANTLRGKKINYKNDLYNVDEADIVPSGVAEIAHLEAEGFAYIRP
jgi:intracellular sulfur oxidation DsrE/DsrF family protein